MSAVLLFTALVLTAHGAEPAFDVIEKTIPELQEAMTAGRVTSRQLVELYLARIAAYDRQGPRLNAMVVLNPNALREADALDGERASRGSRGPLHGTPILIKDNFETAGMPTAAGSLALATYQSKTDAYQVEKLRAAGAVIIGKTNMHELAAGITSISSVAGQTRNPYDPLRNPGGSSGGTGAALAASFAAAGMGSDTCGSIRIPAANNNLVGLRGTRGLASGRGIVPLSTTQDIGGPLARTLGDLALMLDATVGPDPEDPSSAASAAHIPRSYVDALRPGGLKGARLGVLELYFGPEEDGSAVVRTAIDEMKKAGAEIVEVQVPGLEELLRDSSVIASEFKFDLAAFLAAREDAPVKSLDEILKQGLYDASMETTLTRRNAVEKRDSEEYRRALIKRDAIRSAVVAAMDEHRLAALLYPTLRRKPARIGDAQQGTTCQLSAASGLPALSVPAGFTEDGLPIGVEFLGRAWSEADLLTMAFGWEQESKLRRAPFSTPALVNGKAPTPVTFTAAAKNIAADFVYDAILSELRYTLRIDAAVRDLRLVALHRGKDDGAGPITARLLEGDTRRVAGTVMLGHQDREALAAGRLYVRYYTASAPLGSEPLRLTLPSLPGRPSTPSAGPGPSRRAP
jgi:Asp-tRNA(Asn)/Glu-tRNA(Gln) amidotransferase A subunit family amidase